MTETEKHKQLKILGRTLLRNRGFDHSQIFEEYKIEIGKRQFIVDICGLNESKISGKKNIAVECGNTNPEKLINLKLFFDEVIHLPYGITSIKSDLTNLIDEQSDTIKTLQDTIKSLQNKNRSLENQLEKYEYNREIRKRIDVLISALYKTSDLRYYSYSKDDKSIEAVMELIEKLYPQSGE